nr:hypothetical protein [Tanacetum cinerariifolium]
MASSKDVATKNDCANNDDLKKRETYKWTDETVLALCRILNKYLMSNGRNSIFKWNKHQSEFEKVSKTKYGDPQLYGLMGDKKIKENDKVKRIRKKQPSIQLQEACAFNDTYHANAENEDTVAGDDLHSYFQYSQDYTPVVNLENQDDPFFTSLLIEIRGENVSTMNQTGGSKQSKKITKTSTTPVQMKCTGRESADTSMFREFMSEQNATQKRALELLLESDTKDQVGKTNIDSVISVMNRMVEDKLIAEYDDLWCFVMTVLEDLVKREFFLNFPANAGRDCIGCIDGTHIGACILENKQVRYIGRKWVPTFVFYFYIGWMGGIRTRHSCFLHALNTSSLNFSKPPRGKYYLVDKGYPDRNGYLVPYSKTRYHQSHFENEMPKLSVQTQIYVIIAASALHNYIRNSSQEDMMFTVMEQHPDYIPQDELHDVRGHDTNNEDNSEGASNEMKQTRNDIAILI